MSRIYDYNRQRGKTVILISHSMEDIARYADKVAVLNEGRLVRFDSTRKVFARAELLKEIGLRPPQVTSIMSALRESFPCLSEGVLTVAEGVEAVLNLMRNRSENLAK